MTRQGSKAIESMYLRKGFAVESTGGGCDAFVRYTTPSEPSLSAYVLVTAEVDASCPASMTEPIVIGLYDSAGASIKIHFPSSTAFLDSLEDA